MDLPAAQAGFSLLSLYLVTGHGVSADFVSSNKNKSSLLGKSSGSTWTMTCLVTAPDWIHSLQFEWARDAGFRTGRQFGRAWDVELHTFSKIILYIIVPSSENIEYDLKKIKIGFIFFFKLIIFLWFFDSRIFQMHIYYRKKCLDAFWKFITFLYSLGESWPLLDHF
jgi:hypothetical protein